MRSRQKARENLCKRVTIGSGLTCDWLTKWCEFLKPITYKRRTTRNIWSGFHWETNCAKMFPLDEIQSLIFTVLQIETSILLILDGTLLLSRVSSALSLSKFYGPSAWLSPSDYLFSREWARNSWWVLGLICRRYLKSLTIGNHSFLYCLQVIVFCGLLFSFVNKFISKLHYNVKPGLR